MSPNPCHPTFKQRRDRPSQNSFVGREAQPKYEQSLADWQNTFNLALYHLAADHMDIADVLYRQALVAPAEWFRMGIDDLQDFLTLFPDYAQAHQMVALLQSTLDTNA
jgi:hypothetical protein